ncbi:MAG: phosphomannomutase/phosphoglucomutase [Rhodospirillales bacterium]|nr:phosphomannomutase/phosphoglucomutase [Rhodospirillales bacterium]
MTDAHKFDPTILREYDIRGIVGDTLTIDDVRAVGRAFGSEIARTGGRSAAVGYDGRLSSPDLEAALVDGLTACGLTVRRIGRGPTPMLYFASHALETDAAAMITGSHNPPEYNGIKMTLNGKSFFGADIQRLGKVAADGDYETGEGSSSEDSVTETYIDRLLEGIDFGRPLKAVWDPGNGAGAEIVNAVCARLPGEHTVINGTIDGTFPAHHPDPTVEKNLVQLKEAVIAGNCDLGIGFDGDADRIGVVDSKGRVLWGDQLLAILAREVLADVPGATIIADVKTSQVLFDEIARMGGDPLMWKTGHSLIKAKMAETGCLLAGEMSGHIFFKHRWYGFDDAIYAALRLLSILGNTDETLDRMLDAMPQMVNTPEMRFGCSEDRKFAVIDEVRARLSEVAGVTVHDIDGVRVQSADGWWLLRASNTQDVLVARCEARTVEGLESLKAVLVGQLAESGLEAPDFG